MRGPGFDILCEDGNVLVVHKPGGVLTQAPPGIDSLEVRVKAVLRGRSGEKGEAYLGVPHRLDRPVSGAMVLALNRRTAHHLAQQFEARTVRKTYWALVGGNVDGPTGTWTDWIRKIPDCPQAEIVASDHPDGRAATLRYRVLGNPRPDITWLEIELETGRMHQIRVQCASRGHMVLGDRQYACTTPFGPATTDAREHWIALHARTLEFEHPVKHDRLSVTAPLPEYWLTAGIKEE